MKSRTTTNTTNVVLPSWVARSVTGLMTTITIAGAGFSALVMTTKAEEAPATNGLVETLSPSGQSNVTIHETLGELEKSPEKQITFPGVKSLFEGRFDLYREDDGQFVRRIVVPKKAAPGKPWVWRARFWRHAPEFDLAMLEEGYHVVYCDVIGLLGNPKAVRRWNAYYQLLVEKYGFAKKPVLEGMSRGGMIVYNWAIANPDKVAAIYGDAPVMHVGSWPGFGSRLLERSYGFKSQEELAAWKGNPIDNLKPLADAKIPIIHVVGDRDKVVPVSENTAIAQKRYQEMGGVFEVIHKKDAGHQHGLKDPTPIVEFIRKNCGVK
ncbi:MAG: alpha/beta hydrolase [Verrucomicrobiae bacterium]|nr:alpha/beta hydrolase [Verrucomicrobiae bacterium]NNJ43989.1 alpha/beta hydrolase [Akkermansiaceae bacterium]